MLVLLLQVDLEEVMEVAPLLLFPLPLLVEFVLLLFVARFDHAVLLPLQPELRRSPLHKLHLLGFRGLLWLTRILLLSHYFLGHSWANLSLKRDLSWLGESI